VSELWIDTDRARNVTAAWAQRGDAWFRAQFELEGDLDRLELDPGDSSALHSLAAASTELWVNASFVRLVAERVESSDGFDLADPITTGLLRRRAAGQTWSSLTNACAPSWAAYSFSSRFGDSGQTFDLDVRAPYSMAGATATERGRHLVMRALSDTGDAVQIRPDEFELVQLSNGGYLVVLPGVTDLSRPDLGLNDHHRSVRDLDRFAYASSRSTSVADNVYAQMVWDGLVAAGVPSGARLMIVGHSYGADTALDLAADTRFNGPAGFVVTHVVAAGYHSQPQLASVGPSTEVLVLQNERDAAVIVEGLGSGHVTGVVDEGKGVFDSVIDLDPRGALGHLGRVARHEFGVALDGLEGLARKSDAVVEMTAGLATGRPDAIVDGADDLLTLDTGTRQVTDHQIVDVFDGGTRGFGHHPANYVSHVEQTADPGLVAFFESVDAAGYATSGTALAVDVSVTSAK
jgi:hypothetical protein